MSRIRWGTTVSAALLGAAALTSCGDSPTGSRQQAHPAVSAGFETAFAEVSRIRLAGSPDHPMGEITGLAIGPRGRLAVADRQSARAFVFDGRGALEAVLGGAGDGRGQFRGPNDVGFDAAGRLYVADAGRPRVTRYSAELALDTVFRLDGAHYAMRLTGVGENVLAYVNAPGVTARRLRLLRPGGRQIRAFHPSRPAYVNTPYWAAATERVLAASDDRVVAGGNLLYPLALYSADGTLVDSIGRPPESWKQAPRLERGAFRPPNQREKFARWRRTFTTIQNVAIVDDRYLVVSHQDLDPEVLAYELAEHLADVYDLSARRKIWTDVELPGPVLAGGERLTVLLRTPPGGWELGTYEVSGR